MWSSRKAFKGIARYTSKMHLGIPAGALTVSLALTQLPSAQDPDGKKVMPRRPSPLPAQRSLPSHRQLPAQHLLPSHRQPPTQHPLPNYRQPLPTLNRGRASIRDGSGAPYTGSTAPTYIHRVMTVGSRGLR
jgi:hypothetical protein